MQNTKFSTFMNNLIQPLYSFTNGPWSKRSISLLSLFVPYFCTSILISPILNYLENNRFLMAFFLWISIEVLITISEILILSKRTKFSSQLVDNCRLGCTYAVVFEAFKLGS